MSCGIVDDIEDILKKDENEFVGNELDEINRVANKSYIIPKKLKKSNLVNEENNNTDSGVENLNDSNVPGRASIYVKTWGCTHNSSDSEYMAGQLAAYGYSLTGKVKLIIFNFEITAHYLMRI
jgi:threonylcarbamoyladenosine tRNA methylthiotransferase CDKAL1